MSVDEASAADHGTRAFEQEFAFTRWPTGDDKALGTLKAEPQEIAPRTGLRFTEGLDDLDYFVEAVIRLASGRPVVLRRHLRSPGPGTDVWVDAGDDAPQALAELTAAFQLGDGDFVWISPEALGLDVEASR